MATERERLERELARPLDDPARALLRSLGAGEEPTELDEIVRRAQAGDAAAREELIARYLPYLNALARRYRVDGLEHLDLVQEACVGLLRALARYDPSQGVPFPAYARWWIRHALQEARSDFVRPLRLPPKALRQLARLKSEHERVYALERREPDTRELAARTAIELDQAEALLAADAQTRSLDEPVAGSEGEIGALGELLADPLSGEEYEEVLDSIAGAQLRALLTRLTEREREVVRARFGFDRPPERLAEVGERLGVSAERVRQIEERALAKLRRSGGVEPAAGVELPPRTPMREPDTVT
ncbi:MAG TPA: sigma-70 family RNA polymerase sigma factor [Gaiellaceae bacterium]|nr:sigma-70 family RNA polymerase sigma factor [Gaiellaceae bacterium]